VNNAHYLGGRDGDSLTERASVSLLFLDKLVYSLAVVSRL